MATDIIGTLVATGIFIFIAVALFKAFKEPLVEFMLWMRSLFSSGVERVKNIPEKSQTMIIYE